jgi:hypothetical protein
MKFLFYYLLLENSDRDESLTIDPPLLYLLLHGCTLGVGAGGPIE